MGEEITSADEVIGKLGGGKQHQIVLASGSYFLKSGKKYKQISDDIISEIREFKPNSFENLQIDISARIKEEEKIEIEEEEKIETDGTSVKPDEMLVHDPARILLQSIVLTEGLHLIPGKDRHEIAFGGIEYNTKGELEIQDKYDTKKEIRYSLADIAIYRMAKIYVQWQGIEAELENLFLENAAQRIKIDKYEREREQMLQASFLKSLIN